MRVFVKVRTLTHSVMRPLTRLRFDKIVKIRLRFESVAISSEMLEPQKELSL